MPPVLKRQTLPELFLQTFPSIVPENLAPIEAKEQFKESINKKVNGYRNDATSRFLFANLGRAQFTLESFQDACVKEALAQQKIRHETDPVEGELTAPSKWGGRNQDPSVSISR